MAENFFTKSSIEKSVEEAEKRAEFLPSISNPEAIQLRLKMSP